jgi:glycine dehydrogenase subunit 1
VTYLSLTQDDRDAMLAAIGVAEVEELFRDIPPAVRFDRRLALEPALSEQELVAHLGELAGRNVDTTTTSRRSPTPSSSGANSSRPTPRISPR